MFRKGGVEGSTAAVARWSAAGALLVFTSAALAGETASPSGCQDLRVGAVTIRGDGPALLGVEAGVFDAGEEGTREIVKRRSAVGAIEYRSGRKFAYWKPLAGVSANTGGGLFGYGGFYLDLGLGRWILSPELTLGGYRRGNSKDLGGTFQVRTGGTPDFSGGSEVGRGGIEPPTR